MPGGLKYSGTADATLVFWGSYDKSKPRSRLLLAGARKAGLDVIECHRSIWERFQDKSAIRDKVEASRILLGWFLGLPGQIIRYLRLPAHRWVVVGYPGPLEVLLLYPFVRMRGAGLAWDVFISLYDTVVRDRKLLSPKNPVSLIIYFLEWLAARVSDQVFLDTRTHAQEFEQLFSLPNGKVGSVWVGAEADAFAMRPNARALEPDTGSFKVLFYGQFIPLHGLDIIVDAIRETERGGGSRIIWTIVGTGQVAPVIDRKIVDWGLRTVRRVPWVEYEDLVDHIQGSHVALGIFGTSIKARSVIPNKVFQVLAAGTSLVTADTPAIRELILRVPSASKRVHLVKAGSPGELASLIKGLSDQHAAGDWPKLDPLVLGESVVGTQLCELLGLRGHDLPSVESPGEGGAMRGDDPQ